MDLGLINRRKSFVLLVCLFCFLHTSKGFSRDPSEDVSFINFIEEAFSYLNITSLGSYRIEDSDECGFACVETPSCFSYNLEASSVDGKRLCELLPSDKYNNSDRMNISQRFHHYSIQSPCSSGPCQNGSTCIPQYENDSYVCACVKGLTGKDCQTELDLRIPVTWPLGAYGLPMTKSGCPRGSFWYEGTRFHDTENDNGSNGWSSPYDLAGKVTKSSMEQKFCMKTQRQTSQYDLPWPEGKYCVFKKGSCPEGMESGYIKWDDEDSNNHNSFSGQLPDGSYGGDTQIEYCCRTDGNTANAINLSTESPFVLLKANTHLCQKVNGMQVRSEFFLWDNEDSNPSSKKIGPVNAQLDQRKNIKLYYCYYYK